MQHTVCNGAALLSSFGEDTTPVFAVPRQSQNSRTPKHTYVQTESQNSKTPKYAYVQTESQNSKIPKHAYVQTV